MCVCFCLVPLLLSAIPYTWKAVSSDQFRTEEFLWFFLLVFLAPFLQLTTAIIFFNNSKNFHMLLIPFLLSDDT